MNECRHYNVFALKDQSVAYLGRRGLVIFRPRTDLMSLLSHLVVAVVLVGATSSKIAQGSVVSNGIGMKFGTNVPHVNMHRLSDGVGFSI